jgi:hypothetical protein
MHLQRREWHSRLLPRYPLQCTIWRLIHFLMFPGFSTVGRQAWEVVGQEQLFIAGDVISLHYLRVWNIHRCRD